MPGVALPAPGALVKWVLLHPLRSLYQLGPITTSSCLEYCLIMTPSLQAGLTEAVVEFTLQTHPCLLSSPNPAVHCLGALAARARGSWALGWALHENNHPLAWQAAPDSPWRHDHPQGLGFPVVEP